MKKTIAIMTFVFVGLNAFGQENPGDDNRKKTNYPYWVISKDVQKLQFTGVDYVENPAVTGPAPVSKGVQLFSRNKSDEAANMVKMTGVPSFVISKGVARMQAERSNQK
jgi:hypothetical protein